MSKTQALKTELQRIFKTITANVYHEETRNKSTYPYLVYELSELTYSYGKTTMQLEVNVIGHGEDSSEVESIADTVQTTLNRYFFINSDIEFTVYKGSRNTIKEPDKQVIRRRMLFEVQLHELKGE